MLGLKEIMVARYSGPIVLSLSQHNNDRCNGTQLVLFQQMKGCVILDAIVRLVLECGFIMN